MKIFCLSDPHLRTTTPACRKDKDFYQTQFSKLRQIEQLIRQHQVDYVVCGGDWFDTFAPSHQLIHDTLAFLNRSIAKWIVTPGNHDIYGATTKTLSRSGLGILWQAGLVETAAFKDDLFLAGSGTEDLVVRVRLLPHSKSVDEKDFFFEKRENTLDILVPHMMLTTHWEPYPHTLITDVKTNAEVVVCSDWHAQFIQQVDKTWFVNSGPLTRQTTKEASLLPGVVSLSFDEKGKVSASIIHLQVADASKVIDPGVKESNTKESSEDFLTTLRASALEQVDRQKLIRMIGAHHKFLEPVIVNSLKRLETVERALTE